MESSLCCEYKYQVLARSNSSSVEFCSYFCSFDFDSLVDGLCMNY